MPRPPAGHPKTREGHVLEDLRAGGAAGPERHVESSTAARRRRNAQKALDSMLQAERELAEKAEAELQVRGGNGMRLRAALGNGGYSAEPY